MIVILSKQGNKELREFDVDSIDIHTKRYVIRIRISGVLIIRKARPKKDLPEVIKYDENLNLTC